MAHQMTHEEMVIRLHDVARTLNLPDLRQIADTLNELSKGK